MSKSTQNTNQEIVPLENEVQEVNEKNSIKGDFPNINLDTKEAVEKGKLFVKYPLEWVTGILIIICSTSLSVLGYNYRSDMKVVTGIALGSFIVLSAIAFGILKYRATMKKIAKQEADFEKQVHSEDKDVEKVIKDFEKSNYYRIEISSNRKSVTVSQKDGVWVMVIKNKVTNTTTKRYSH